MADENIRPIRVFWQRSKERVPRTRVACPCSSYVYTGHNSTDKPPAYPWHPAMRDSDEKGFTLIEMMIALALLGMMMTLITGSYYASARAKRRMESRLELVAMGRVALDTMIKEINGALMDTADTSSTPFVGEYGGSFDHPQDSLYFTTTSFDPRPLGAGGNIAETSYRLEENDEMRGSFFLKRRSDPFPDFNPKEGGVTYDIAEQLRGLRIRYQDDNGVWSKRWDSSTSGKLPRLVEITIHLRGKNGGTVQLRGVAAPMRWTPSEFSTL